MSRIPTFFEAMSAAGGVRRRLNRDMQALGIRFSRPTIRFSGLSLYLFDCEISREGPRYTFDFAGDASNPDLRRIAAERASTFAYWLWHCPPEVRSIIVDMSDGNHASRSRFAGSVRESHAVPLPDAFFFGFRGYRDYRSQAEQDGVAWHARSGRLRWRGTTSGAGTVADLSRDAMWNPQVLPRLRMALILAGQPGCDVAFAGSNQGEGLAKRLQTHGLLAEPIPEADWIDDKFALDIDGHTNTWSNFLVRLHLGCCVLKVDSQQGYRQWYYDRIRPWEHFVPVRADMTDLAEKIDWVRSNDARAKEIAANGQAFARSMTFESETAWAARAITEASGMPK